METRANYVLIGAFTLAGLLGAMGLLLWLAKVQVDRQYAYYDVLFEDVSGLGEAGDVRYNGLPVGQVVALALDPEDPSKVRVTLEVAAETPVKADTTATLQLQGVTGVSFVALSGGSPQAEAMPQGGVITTERSAIQSIFEGAPELLEKAIALLEDVNRVVDSQNQQAVDEVLANLASASGRLDRTLEDFEGLSGDLSLAARAVAGFAGRLDELSGAAETTLETATEALGAATTTVRRAEGTVEAAETAFLTADELMKGDIAALLEQGTSTAAQLEQTAQALEGPARQTLEAARLLAATTLPLAVAEIQQVAANLDDRIGVVGDEMVSTLATYRELGEAATARAEQAETALAAFETATVTAEQTLANVRDTAAAATAFIETDATALAADARGALTGVQALTEERLPPLIDQATTTLATVDREAAKLSTDASGLIETANARLTEAQSTLTRVDGALDGATQTLASVRTTSDSVNALVQGDGAALVAEARATVETVGRVVEEDVPALAAELRGAAEGARAFIETDATALAAEAQGALASVRGLTDERLPPLIDQATTTLATLDREAAALSGDAAQLMEAATARLGEAQATIARLDGALDGATETMASVRAAADNANAIIEGDGAALVAEARAAAATARGAIDAIDAAVQAELPGVMEAVRGAAASADSLFGQAGGDFNALADRFGGLAERGEEAIAAATATFTEANGTLTRINAAMETAQGTLAAAETTFLSVNEVIDEDLDAIVVDVRRAVNAFTATVEGASDDIDAIGAQVQSASASASQLMGNLNGIVGDNRRQMSDFLRVGLPQFLRFTEEARRLITNLERLADRVERDPARFLLGTTSSEFRR